jgi:hypothetical protein
MLFKMKPAAAYSISDDDLCVTCARCAYNPGMSSVCNDNWPAMVDSHGYVQECESFQSIALGTTNLVELDL